MRVLGPTLFLFAPLALLVACGGSDAQPTTSPATDADAALPPSDAHSSDDSTPSADVGGDAAAPTCTTGCATLAGKVMRVALTKPQNGGKGSVYVAVFDKDPVIDRAGAKLVGQTKIENCDMTADTASVPYTIAALPPRADPYFVVAFLDDNENAGGATPGPDKGDLVSLDGLAAPKVSLPTGGATVTLDISLNAVLPF